MTAFIKGNTCLDVWKNASQHLLDKNEEYNLIVTIENPIKIERSWLIDYNPILVNKTFRDIRDVANTIFPLRTFLCTETRSEFYSRYMRAYRKGRARPRNKAVWGTYFQRLISFGRSEINQLENAIQAKNKWNKNYKTPFFFHLSSSEIDNFRPRGGPCWQYGQLLCTSRNTLEMVAIYRNQDYFSKALGNFIGLSRLLKFICGETNMKAGKIICHSMHAFFSSTKVELRSLMNVN